MSREVAAHHPCLDLQLLGGFHLTVEGVSLPGLDKTRWQELIAYLVLQRLAPVSRAQVAFTLWPDTREAQALTNLRNLLLGRNHHPGQPPAGFCHQPIGQ